MMNNVIYQASDLASQRVVFLNEARNGRARLRDKDGTSLVMLPEHQLEVLEQYAVWSQIHLRLSKLIASPKRLSAADLGDLAWLRVFDSEDLQEFADELHSSLIVGLSDKDLGPVEETVAAWRTTARQLEDPLRRSVLLSRYDEVEFEQVVAPKENA